MAVVTGPLLSFGASGQIAKTQVYSRWKGRPYVRKLVVPSNPRSTGQTQTRTAFSFLSDTWKLSPADFRSPWQAFSKALVMTDRNAWMKQNLPIIRGNADLTGIILSPGAAGGLTVLPAISGGAGDITIGLTAPAPLPAGWSIISAIGAAVRDQDPSSPDNLQIYTNTDSTTPYSVVISGLAAGDYRAAGWFVFQRSASLTDLAYGAGPTQQVTVT